MTETNGNSLTPFSRYALDHLSQDVATRGKITPIGGILYAQGKRLIMAGELDIGSPDFRGNLIYTEIDVPQDFNFDKLAGFGNRIQDLRHFTSIDLVAQVTTNDVRVDTFDSVRAKPKVSIGINYRDPLAGEQFREFLDEEELLRVFTAERGGLLVFDGGNLPEETALLVDREAQGKRHGLVFFFHPQGESWGINSARGLEFFVRQLNTEFVNSARGFPSQKKWLAALDRAVEKGAISFDLPVRLDLFKTIAIAHARMFERTGENRYIDFLNQLLSLPAEPLRVMGIPLQRSPALPNLTSQAEQAVDSLIFKDSNVRLTAEEILDKVIKQLKTEQAKLLRRNVARYYGQDNRYMREFMKALHEMILSADNLVKLEDVSILLEEASHTPFANARMIYNLDVDHPGDRMYFVTEPYSTLAETQGSDLIHDFQTIITNIKIRWSK